MVQMRRLRTLRPSRAGAVCAGLYLLILGYSLIQQPGRTTYDTRLELTQYPGHFLASAFSLWQPGAGFGELQNQAYGYLFPQGPFFWLGDLLGSPAWVTQRVWSAVVIVIACEGARRVARALGLSAPAAIVAGLAFAFSPRILGTVTVISAETLPGAVLPWALLPVILAFTSHLTPGRAAILSGAAVVCMGGVNAVETAANLPLIGLVVLWACWQRRTSWRFAALWSGAVVAASLWWVLPLLVLSRVSPPFYQYVESATNTTSLAGWSEAVRGDTQWQSSLLLPGGQPWWPASHMLATNSALVVIAALIAALGLLGLARWSSDLRLPFVMSAAMGLVVMTIAHGGPAGSPLSGVALRSLDGPLQIFRNIHKFDPTVRLPLAIGFAVVVSLAIERLVAWRPGLDESTAGLFVLPACVVLCLGAPFVVNSTRTHGWTEFPAAWASTQHWLEAHDDGRNTLVLPGSGFALQTWGATMDEPLLGLDVRHRVTLTQVPLIPGQSIRYLSALNELVTSGRADAHLADELARAGIGHVVLRRDLDRTLSQSPYPGGAEVALSQSGLSRVAAFGPLEDGGPQISVYDVSPSQPTVRLTDLSTVTTVAGEPESVLALQQNDLIEPSQATVLAHEPGWNRPPGVVTDQAQRRERAFGNVYEPLSAVMQKGEPFRVERAVHDYPGVAGAPEVTARYDGLTSLEASSSQGFADTFGAVVAQAGPASAVDGDPATRWLSSPGTDPRGQWIRMVFTHDRPVHDVSVLPVVDDPALAPIRVLRISAGNQTQQVAANPTGAAVTAHFDGREVGSVTVRITSVRSSEQLAAVGLREVTVDGEGAPETLVVPTPLDGHSSFLFTTDPGARACSSSLDVPDCDASRIRGSEEPEGMHRTFTATTPEEVTLRGRVVARGTNEAARLLDPVGHQQEIGATSIYGADPRVSSRFVYDGNPATAWIPDDADPNPTLLLRWSRARRVTGLQVLSRGAPDEAPRNAVLTASGHRRRVALPGDGMVRITPVRTKFLQVSFPRVAGQRLVVSELRLRGADITQPFDAAARTGAKCGLGPHLVMDGWTYQTRVSGTLGDIVTGQPLNLSACQVGAPRSSVRAVISAGQHQLLASPSAEYTTISVVGQVRTTPDLVALTRSARVTRWGTSQREVRVGPGATSLLSIPENFNPGWTAALADRPLRSLHVDGWQQGWVVPAGAGGVVHLAFGPQTTYVWSLGIGLGLAALLLVAAMLVLITSRRGRTGTSGIADRRRGAAAALTREPFLTAAVFLVLIPLAGFVVAATFGLTFLVRRIGVRSLATVGGVLVLASGVGDVVTWSFVPRSLGDVCAAAGFGVLFALALGGPRQWQR